MELIQTRRPSVVLTFWGVRGSFPQCNRAYVGIGGHTSCVGIETRSGLFIFDAGTGIIDLGDWIAATPLKSVSCFITHPHMDHISGIPFFQPLFDSEFSISFYSAAMKKYGGVESVLSTVISPPYFPLSWESIPSRRSCIDLEEESVITIRDVTIASIPLLHPGGSSGYRLTHDGISIAYITDTGHNPGVLQPELVRFCERADLLIYDSMFTEIDFLEKSHFGHSTWEHAIALAKASCVKELALYHHNPFYDDFQMTMIESYAQNQFSQSFVARQGMIRVLGDYVKK